MHVVKPKIMERICMPLHSGVSLTSSGIAAVAIATAESQ